MEQPVSGSSHKLQMNERRIVTISGVLEVVSFDNKEVLFETSAGMLQFKGDNFKVKRLTLEKGEVDMEGRVDSLAYFENQNLGKTAGGLLGRLFR